MDERLKDWVVDLIGAAISEGKFIDCDREETAGLLLNSTRRPEAHPLAHRRGRPRRRGDPGRRAGRHHRGARTAEASSEIARISAQAAQFDDAATALRGAGPQSN